MLIKIAQFFLCFTILIGIHELGHYIMARIFKIRVEKFYIFFNPWFSLFKFKRGDTEYGLGWLPLGGYVKIAGMIDESLDTEQMKQPVKIDEFRAKPAWQRFLVMIAGVMMNVLLAIAIYIGIAFTWGDTYLSNQEAKWGYNFSEVGHRLGFQDADRIVSIDGQQIDNINEIIGALLITGADRKVVVERAGAEVELTLPFEELIAMRRERAHETLLTLRIPFIIDSVEYQSAMALQRGDEIIAINDFANADFPAFRKYILSQAGGDVSLTIKRNGEVLEGIMVPVSPEGAIGVRVLQPDIVRTQEYSLLQAVPAGFRKAGDMISSYWGQLRMIAQPKTKMYEELGGFITIGSIFPPAWDWQMFWIRTALLSIILAVMNILPIPGLDGGHAIFTFWEMVTGRKVSDKVLLGAQYVGFAIIIFLLLYANMNDVYRFFIKSI